ncbi:MAG TPA: hypothetical protein VNO32_30325 [Candidatus Acidoferrum sp.]|nr:hypothetical protein [Candidatus Acidoferrum sp.]
MRKLIQEADPNVIEEWKWRGTPVWSYDGIICAGESYKNVTQALKTTFVPSSSSRRPFCFAMRSYLPLTCLAGCSVRR